MKKYLIQLYEMIYPQIRQIKFSRKYLFRIMTPNQTIKYVERNKCSIARFGDGEFGLITGTNNPDFQSQNGILANRLSEIALVHDKRVLICIPQSFKRNRHLTKEAKDFWEWWKWDKDNLFHVATVLGLNSSQFRLFGDASITRPYMDWKDKSKAGTRFNKLKTLWQGRDLLIVEGEHSRLGVGNDLFNESRSICRIIAPSKNAFDVYEVILSSICELGNDRLILLALGPTATVLAYDLALRGFQAFDIGHIDIEYEWFLSQANEKESIPGKECQELHENFRDIKSDKNYLTQIILKIPGKSDTNAKY